MIASHRSGWSVVSFGFVALALAFAARALLSLVMTTWEDELGWSRSFISAGGAVALIIMAAIAPIAGDLIDRHGPRRVLGTGLLLIAAGMGMTGVATQPWQYLLAFGLVAGLGFGIVATNVLFAAVAPHFQERRGLALGVVDAGTTAGQLLVVPAAALLLGLIGWRRRRVRPPQPCRSRSRHGCVRWRLAEYFSYCSGAFYSAASPASESSKRTSCPTRASAASRA